MYLNVSGDSLEQKRAISQADLIYNRDTGLGGGGGVGGWRFSDDDEIGRRETITSAIDNLPRTGPQVS